MRYLAMNNFQVALDQADAFEERWRQRRSSLHEVPGFESFYLLRGAVSDGAVHYASHSTWASKEAFEAWTRSDHFVQAHRGDPLPKGMVLGHPQLECFEVVQLRA
jgi:heme-degrading monooxygenase HmoA